jgi:hypothetical protein
MTKTNETKFPAEGREHMQDVHAAAKHGPKHPVGSKSKKERPASKGRVHKEAYPVVPGSSICSA